MPGAYLYGWVGDPVNAWVKCKVTDEGKLIINPAGFLENPPTEDEANKAATSEWSYDHWKDPAAHHAKFTAVEARAAINNILTSSGHLTGYFYCDHWGFIKLGLCYWKLNAASDYRLYAQALDTAAVLTIRGYHDSTGNEMARIQLTDGTDYYDVITEQTFQAELDDYLENPPTEDVDDKAPTSEWAFDHDADVSAHHAKYTDLEAVESFKNRAVTLTTGNHDSTDLTNYSMVYLDSSGGDITLRGFAGGSDGKIVFFVTKDDTNVTYIRHEHATPAAANRILTPSVGDESIWSGVKAGLILIYLNSRWIMLHSIY